MPSIGGETVSRRLTNEEPRCCRVCGDQFQPRRQSHSNELGILCSRPCANVYRTNTKNIRTKGRRGGISMRIILEVGLLLSERTGEWVTTRHLAEVLTEMHIPVAGHKLARMLPIYTNLQVERRSSGTMVRLDAPIEHLGQILRSDVHRDILRNYGRPDHGS